VAGKPIFNEMPTEKILDLLDQAHAMGFRGRVAFYHYSEPLLDKRNIMLAQEAKRRGLRPYLHTNGDVLKHDVELCEQVKNVYGLIVIGLYDYETTEQLEEAKLYWQSRLAGANLEFSPIGLSAETTAYSIAIPRALVPTQPRMAAPDLTFANGPCHRPLIRMLVQHDGEMCHCCEDTYGAFKLGNVYEHSLEELWYSDCHARAILDLSAGHREKFDLCQNCPLPPTAPAPAHKIEIVPRRYNGV
jgi:radical SAM protein with 4Fe4S-binding SPASM domain